MTEPTPRDIMSRAMALPEALRIPEPNWGALARAKEDLARAREALEAESSGGGDDAVSAPKILDELMAIAINAWRLRSKMVDAKTGEPTEEMKRVYRHVESIYDALGRVGVKVEDPIGQRYDPGMVLRVISFEEKPALAHDEVGQVVKPSILFRDKLVHVGEVIVYTAAQDR